MVVMRTLLLLSLVSMCCPLWGQTFDVHGQVVSGGAPVPFAVVGISGTMEAVKADSTGVFRLAQVPAGSLELMVMAIGYENTRWQGMVKQGMPQMIYIDMLPQPGSLSEVVVTGSLKAVSRAECPIPIEIYNTSFFKKNPAASLFESMQNINGVRPQNNCNVCNTGDIHINGLEGAYTLVLIDGMPLVSSLGSVYGLFGIPRSLIERVEIVRGPAAALYGSESMGGLINVITKRPETAPKWSMEFNGGSWFDHQLDIGHAGHVGKRFSVLTGVNYYGFNERVDHDRDGFTDVALQSRISVFQKWRMQRKDHRLFSFSARYYYEDRWGGEVEWQRKDRGRDTYYGESIYTNRWECLGVYQLPIQEKIMLQWSYIEHQQNSVYGLINFQGHQRVALAQMTWDKKIGKWDGLLGISNRYTYYDDNTTATTNGDPLCPLNQPSIDLLPGLFAQTEWLKNASHRLLLGARMDYHALHGMIFTPRIAHKWTLPSKQILRFNIGSGFRVVNVFNEEHAALTGARQVVVASDLEPERSTNASIAFATAYKWASGLTLTMDLNVFYTYFQNRILPDYVTDANTIFYNNLNGHADNKGLNLSVDGSWRNRWRFNTGITWTETVAYTWEDDVLRKTRPFFNERFAGAWSITYVSKKRPITIDYTGNVYSPMLLPLLGPLDPRSSQSPWWSIQNIQMTYKAGSHWEWFGGVKNLLNWTPKGDNPFLIARAHDPFDKHVEFDSQGQAIATPTNPYGLTFDPSYVYAPNQGVRVFVGVRWEW